MNVHKRYMKDRWEKRKQLVLDAIIVLYRTQIFNETGVSVSGVKEMLLYLNKDVKIGIHTVREVFHDLENESVIFCVNPSNCRHRRYLLVKKEGLA